MACRMITLSGDLRRRGFHHRVYDSIKSSAFIQAMPLMPEGDHHPFGFANAHGLRNGIAFCH